MKCYQKIQHRGLQRTTTFNHVLFQQDSLILTTYKFSRTYVSSKFFLISDSKQSLALNVYTIFQDSWKSRVGHLKWKTEFKLT